MIKKSQSGVASDGPTPEYRQHAMFTKESIKSNDTSVIWRHRKRAILTPSAVRRAILEDIAAKPEGVKLRSIRRRLTVLDRALSDREAEAIERLTNCMNGLSNIGCVNYLKSEVRSTPYGRMPFHETQHREIEAMAMVFKGLTKLEQSFAAEIAHQVDVSQSAAFAKLDEPYVQRIVRLAARILMLYDAFHKKNAAAKHNPQPQPVYTVEI